VESDPRHEAPLFYVFLPVLNDSEWLPGAIESVIGQTTHNWQMVIGDNASDEDLPSVVGPYLGDSRITYHRWSTRVDIFPNFNRTLGLGRAPWLVVLCADDRLRPTYLERVQEVIDARVAAGHAEPGMVLTAARRLDAERQAIEAEYYGWAGPAFVASGVYDAPSWLDVTCRPGSPPWGGGVFSRRIVETMGVAFREDDLQMSADRELWLRIAAYGDVAYIATPLLDVSGWTGSHTHGRTMRNRVSGNANTPEGSAYLRALTAHAQRRHVAEPERAMVFAAVARSHQRRAMAHRMLPGGRGRRGAVADVWRAIRHSPRTALAPIGLAYAGLAVLAPGGVLRFARRRLLATRSRRANEPGSPS